MLLKMHFYFLKSNLHFTKLISLYLCILTGVLSFSIQALGQSVTESPSVEEQIFDQLGSLTLLELAPLTREELIEKLEKDLNIQVKSNNTNLFNRYFLSYIYNYFQAIKPDDSLRVHTYYELYSSETKSQRLVLIQDDNKLYFAPNAGDSIITNKFKEIMDAAIHPNSILPDTIQMTFEYNNTLYAQLNQLILSSEDIKNFIHKHSRIVFSKNSNDTKSFTRDELLMMLKQYLDIPVHIRDNLLLKELVRVESIPTSDIFETVRGTYNPSQQVITLADAAFQTRSNGESERGETTFLHEIGHALWGKSIWEGLPKKTKTEYKKLSWHEGKTTSDEFISNYSTTNVLEDFAEHFAAYINNGNQFKIVAESKYNWFKEHIFLNVEYLYDVADNLKLFVQSDDEDTTPPYFIKPPDQSVSIDVIVDDEQADDWKNGYAYIKVEVSGLFSDVSKIKWMSITMETSRDIFSMLSPAFRFCSEESRLALPKKILKNCVYRDLNRPGWYSYYTRENLALSYAGDYKISQIELADEAGNRRVLRSNLGDVTIYFPGVKDKIEQEAREKKRKKQEAREKKKKEEAKAREKQRREQEAREKKRKEQERQRQAETNRSIEEQERANLNFEEGFSVFNSLKHPVKVMEKYKEISLLNPFDSTPLFTVRHQKEIETLNSGECITLDKREFPLISLEKITGWFDAELDDLICSNSDSTESNGSCHFDQTSVIKKNKHGVDILTDAQNKDLEGLNQQCKLSPIKQEEREVLLQSLNQKTTGLNIFNLSNQPIRIYQHHKEVLDLRSKKCVSLTEGELIALTLKKIDKSPLGENSFICTNIDNSLNLSKCDVKATSMVKQNSDREYVLVDYQKEKSVDFRSCTPLMSRERLDLDQNEEDSSSRFVSTTDNTAPYFVNLSNQSISVSTEPHRNNRHYVLFKVEVNGLFDDVSDISEIDVLMRSKSPNDIFWVSSPSSHRLCNDLSSAKNESCIFMDTTKLGRYVYYQLIDRADHYAADYRVKSFHLKDAANNSVHKSYNYNSTVFFPGERLNIDSDQIKRDLEVRTSKTDDEDTVVHIFTTDLTQLELGAIRIQITNTDTEEELEYSIDPSKLPSLNKQLNSHNVSGKMSLPIVIPKELKSARYQLNWIRFLSETWQGSVRVRLNSSNIYFDHHSSKSDTSIARPLVDDISMEIEKGRNRLGGDTSIKIDIPIAGLDRGQGAIRVEVKTPTGDTNVFRSNEIIRMDLGDVQNTEWMLPLKPHHAEGEYMITKIEVMEDYSDFDRGYRGLKLREGGSRVHAERLLEREIRTTLNISIPPPEREKH